MTGIAAAVARTKLDVTPVVSRMLDKIKHRGGDGFGLACPRFLQESASASDFGAVSGNVVLGAVNRKSLFDDQNQPFGDEGCFIVLDGRFEHSGSVPDIAYSAEVIKGQPRNGLQDILAQEPGAYVAAVLSESKLLLARDSIGTIPAYLGVTPEFFAVSTEKKALWEVGVRSVSPLPPGHITELSANGVSPLPMNLLRLPPIQDISSGQLVRMLERSSRDVFDAAFRKVERIAVAFSGGLDSSLAACLADKSGVEVELISVGLEKSRDLANSQDAAEVMGLPFVAQTHQYDDVGETLDEAIYLTEDPDPLQIQIAIPVLWAAKAAAERRHRWLVLGQGLDELFGGYQKYLNRFLASGSNCARQLMFSDLVSGSERGFVRDNKVVSSQGVDLALPFLTRGFIELALSVPVEYKLAKGANPERKMILRELANLLGLPTEVAHRKKAAIQYSTGVSQALHRLAKRKGLTLTQLTHKRFFDIFGRKVSISEERVAPPTAMTG